jgi:hypothetical protein
MVDVRSEDCVPSMLDLGFPNLAKIHIFCKVEKYRVTLDKCVAAEFKQIVKPFIRRSPQGGNRLCKRWP